MFFTKAIPRMFGYDAIKSSSKRTPPRTSLGSEDIELRSSDRLKMVSTTRDVRRNFAVAAWAIRKHLDYVSRFSFQAKTGDTSLDNKIETLVRQWSNRNACDAAGRHSFRRMIRIAEASRVVDGDVFFMLLNNGTIHLIEGDRVRSDNVGDLPKNLDTTQFTQGVKAGSFGRATGYLVTNREGSRFNFARILSPRQVVPLAYYDRYDQVRGISPIASALTSFQDVYEGMDYALMKLKISQLFAVAFYRDAVDGLAEEHDGETDGSGDPTKSGYSASFKGNGPKILDLADGDRVEVVESDTPAADTQSYLKLMIDVALKSLDIPSALFDESRTNFAGLNAAIRQYKRSCEDKQQDIAEVLDEITRWRLTLWASGNADVSPRLTLPDGVSVSDLRWEWVPDGVPWWDRAKEVVGDIRAIGAGLDNPQNVCRMTGTDFRENIDRIAEAQEYAAEKGVSLSFVADGPIAQESQADES